MDYGQMRTATLRSIFASAYVANIVIALLFIINHGQVYLNAVASIIVIFLSGVMLSVTLQQPEKAMVYFETSGHTVVFTFFTRTVCDISTCILLLGMSLPGQIMSIITLVFLATARGLAQKRPDIFRELFRAHANDPEMGETDAAAIYEETGDGGTNV